MSARGWIALAGFIAATVLVVAVLLLRRDSGSPLEAPSAATTPSAAAAASATSGEPSEPGSAVTEEEQLVTDLIEFARSPSAESAARIPFASDGVWLGLSDRILGRRTVDELTDPRAWVLNVEAFRGHVGPFSALELLADSGPYSVTIGDHPHCASPPVPPPDDVADATRVSVQPTGIDTCLRWWTVDLFLNAAGELVAITLDLWDP
jgi:hypothetical protein